MVIPIVDLKVDFAAVLNRKYSFQKKKKIQLSISTTSCHSRFIFNFMAYLKNPAMWNIGLTMQVFQVLR